MRSLAKTALGFAIVAIALAPSGARAQAPEPANPSQDVPAIAPGNEAKSLTGKERLGEKWKDEQRIDNCNVPPDKRGTKPRPESCAHQPKG